MAKSRSGPRKGVIYTVTGGLLVFGFLMMAFYDTGTGPRPKAIASLVKPPR